MDKLIPIYRTSYADDVYSSATYGVLPMTMTMTTTIVLLYRVGDRPERVSIYIFVFYLLQIRSSRFGPGDGHLPIVGVEPERLPHRRGPIYDVVGARGLEVVLIVAAVERVALVYDHGRHGPAVARPDHDAILAPLPFVEPPRGQRHHRHVVVEERAGAAGRAAAVSALREAVERQRAAGAGRHRRGARERRVALPTLAAHGVVIRVAAAGLAADGAVGLAGLEERAVGEGGKGYRKDGRERQGETSYRSASHAH